METEDVVTNYKLRDASADCIHFSASSVRDRTLRSEQAEKKRMMNACRTKPMSVRVTDVRGS